MSGLECEMSGLSEKTREACEQLDDLLGDGPFRLDDAGYGLLGFMGFDQDQVDEAAEVLVSSGRVEMMTTEDGLRALRRSERWSADLEERLGRLSGANRRAVLEGVELREGGYPQFFGIVVRALMGAGFSRGEIMDIFSHYPIGQPLEYLRHLREWVWLDALIDQEIQRMTRARMPQGENFEVTRVVRVESPSPAYLVTVRTGKREASIYLTPSRLLHPEDFRVSCIKKLNLLPTLPEGVSWGDFVQRVVAVALPGEPDDAVAVAPPREPKDTAPFAEWVPERGVPYDAGALVEAIVDLLRETPIWTGTMTALFDALTSNVTDPPMDWQRSHLVLRRRISLSVEELGAAGIVVAFHRASVYARTRLIQLRRTPQDGQ